MMATSQGRDIFKKRGNIVKDLVKISKSRTAFFRKTSKLHKNK